MELDQNQNIVNFQKPENKEEKEEEINPEEYYGLSLDKLKKIPLRKLLPDDYLKNLDSNFKYFCKQIRKNMQEENYEIIGITGFPGCQPKNSRVLMANGEFKNIQDIKIGDYVLSPQFNGKNIYSKVLSTSFYLCKNIYEVKELNRNNKSLYFCSNNHLIPFYRKKFGRYNGKRNYKDKQWLITHHTAEEYSNISNDSKNRHKISFSSFLIEKFKDRINCKIEPYSLGVFLGDGSYSSIPKLNRKNKRWLGITSNNFEILEEISKHYPISNIYQKNGTTAKSYTFSINSNFANLLTEYNLEGKNSGNKFIPKEALYSDSEYRKKLLAGLIDTDGYYDSGGYEILTKSEQLSKDIEFLIYSLGGRCYIKKVKKSIKKINFTGEYFRIRFYLKDLSLPLKVKYKIKKESSIYLSSNRLAIDCKKSNENLIVYGLELDSPSKWYITDNFMVTHNTGKSQITSVLGCLIDKNYSFGNNINFIPTANQIEKDYLKLPMFSFLHIDEASRSIHKHKWYEKTQQKLATMYDVERENHYICSGLIMPRFTNFAENFRNFFIKYWINIICRSIVIVYRRDEDKDTKDPWNLDENIKLKKKYWGHKRIFERSVSDIIRMEQKTKNYWFYFTIPEIPKEVWSIYKALKKQSRVELRENESKNEIEDYKTRLEREKLNRWKQVILLRNKGNTYDEIAITIGKSSNTIKRDLAEIRVYHRLKGDVYGLRLEEGNSTPKDTNNNIYNLKDMDKNKINPSEFNIP